MHYCALLNRLDVAEFLIRKRSMVDPKDSVYFPVLIIQLLFSGDILKFDNIASGYSPLFLDKFFF